MRRHAAARAAIVLALAAVGAAACVRPRRIYDPVPDAVQIVVTDSADRVLHAVERAIADEGLPIRITDPDRRYVESQPIDIAAMKTLGNPELLSDVERIVRFRFFVRTDLGATRVFGEAVYQPSGADLRAMQRMVPSDHPARQVLARMLENVKKHLRE